MRHTAVRRLAGLGTLLACVVGCERETNQPSVPLWFQVESELDTVVEEPFVARSPEAFSVDPTKLRSAGQKLAEVVSAAKATGKKVVLLDARIPAAMLPRNSEGQRYASLESGKLLTERGTEFDAIGWSGLETCPEPSLGAVEAFRATAVERLLTNEGEVWIPIRYVYALSPAELREVPRWFEFHGQRKVPLARWSAGEAPTDGALNSDNNERRSQKRAELDNALAEKVRAACQLPPASTLVNGSFTHLLDGLLVGPSFFPTPWSSEQSFGGTVLATNKGAQPIRNPIRRVQLVYTANSREVALDGSVAAPELDLLPGIPTELRVWCTHPPNEHIRRPKQLLWTITVAVEERDVTVIVPINSDRHFLYAPD